MDSDHTFGSLDNLRYVSVQSLANSMRDVYSDYDYDRAVPDLDWLARFTVNWSLDPAADFDDDLSIYAPVALCLTRRGALAVEIVVAGGPQPKFEEDTWPAGKALLSEWLIPRRGEVLKLRPGEIGYRGYWVAWFTIPTRGLNVADIQAVGMDAIALLDAHASGTITIDSSSTLLRSGRSSTLIGLPENQLLEAKRVVYLVDDKHKFELAKDISGIANSATGGVLVVGLETTSTAGRDQISRITPLPDAKQAKLIRAVIERRVYPPIEGLQVEGVPADAEDSTAGKLIMIIVPPQPAELRPFLVNGAVVDGKVNGTLIGLYERRGEDVIDRSPASIHAALSAGLALLRGH